MLSAICAVGGLPVVKNQQYIIQSLLENASNRKKLIMPIRMNKDGNVDVLFDYQEPEGNWKELNNYRTFKRQQYGYFLSTIDLSSELCIGRNQSSLENLQDIYAFDSVIAIIKNQDLPPEMRAIFMRLMLNMHMDRDPLVKIEIPSRTGVWDSLPPFIPEQFIDSSCLEFNVKQSLIQAPPSLIFIKQFVEKCLSDTQGVMNIFEVGKNMIIIETLKIINFMLNHGFYYDLKELKQLSLPMIQLLNGANDQYYNLQNNDEEIDDLAMVKRYFSSAENDLIIQSKILICKNLLTISMLETNGKAEVFLSKFKIDLEMLFARRKQIILISQNAEEKNQQPNQVSQVKNEVSLCDCFSKRKFQAEKDDYLGFKQTQDENIEFLDKISNFLNFESENIDSYICVLFDLLLYREPKLAKEVFELQVRLFCRKRILIENLMGIQMLESPNSIKVLDKIAQYNRQLRNYVDDADQWLNKTQKRTRKYKKKVTEIFATLAQICFDKPEDEQNESSLKKEKSLRDLDLLEEKLNNISKERSPKESATGVNPQDFILFNDQDKLTNKENQRLIASFQLDQVAMFIIKYRVDREVVNDPSYNELILQCYKFLIAYVKDNFTNQIKVHNNLEIFLRDIDKNPLICLLIYEIFRDNKRFLMLNVTKILRQIISSAEEAPLTSSKKALYLKLLEVFCKFEEKLVRPNQQEIVINFTRDVAKNNLIYLFSLEGVNYLIKMIRECLPQTKARQLFKALRNKQITNGQSRIEESKIEPTAHISMPIFNVITCLDLMSICCEGKSDRAEQKCQSELLNMPTAAILYKQSGRLWPLKSSIIRYVAQVFLDSNNTLLFSVIEWPQNCNSLKQILEFIRQDLIKINQEWTDQTNDIPLHNPDGSITSLMKESQTFAMIHAVSFLKKFLKNKRLEQFRDMNVLLDITKCVSKMYYHTQDEDMQLSALELLVFINSSQKLAQLLENLQHPANQNIYLANRKMKRKKRQIGIELENGQKTTVLSSKLLQLAFSKKMIEEKEKEFESMVLWVTNIDMRLNSIIKAKETYFKNDSLNNKAFFNIKYERIIAAFMSLLDSQSLKKDLHITGLYLLRKCVEVFNLDTSSPAADWQTEDWIKYQKIIEAKQNMLVEIGCIEFLCKHIQEVDDEDILEATFLTSITLLVGGNRSAQDAFYKFLIYQDPLNALMMKFRKLFDNLFDRTKKVIAEKNAKLSMIYQAIQRKELRQAKIIAEVSAEEEQELDDNQIFALAGFTLEQIVQKEDENQEIIIEEVIIPDNEGDQDSEQLLTIDESIDEGDGRQIKNEIVDDMFMVRQDKTQSVVKCIRMLRFLQLLTEGQHSNLQNFLREQIFSNDVKNLKSFDFINYLAQLLALYEKQYINCYSCSLADQLFSTLIETIQGPCKANQMKLVDAKIIDCCRDLIQKGVVQNSELKMRGFTTPEKMKFHDSLISQAIKMLLSIIEGPLNKVIYQLMANSFDDFQILTKRMEQIYFRFVVEDLGLDIKKTNLQEVNASLKRESLVGNIIEGFNIYSLINQISILIPEVMDKLGDFVFTDTYKFFKTNTGNIEIQKDGEIMTIFFPIQPVTKFLTERTKINFLREVERQSNNHKIIDLIAHIPQFIDELNHLYEQSHYKVKITPDRLNAFRDTSTLLAITIAIIIISFYKYDRIERADGTSDFKAYIEPIPDELIVILGYAQLFTSFTLLIGYVFNKFKLIVRSGWRKKITENRIMMKKEVIYILNPLKPTYGELRAKDLPVNACRILLFTEGPYHSAWLDEDGESKFYHFSLELEYKWNSLCFLFYDYEMVFLMLYCGFSVLGMIQSRIFYSFHLLDCVNRFPQLQDVIQSVTVNGNQLLMTALLGLIIIFIFSVVGFIFISDTYYRDEINQGILNKRGDNICQNMLHCFLTILNYGIRGGGGISDYLPTISYDPKIRTCFYFRFCYDVLYFIIINTCLLNIIFGVIIDTFAELRDKKAEMEEDMQNVCFICNIDRSIFDRDTQEGFEYHCINDHDVWQYLNFIIYLKSIDETELNGTESYILNLFVKDDISWFPMSKSQKLIMNRQRREEMRKALQKQDEEEGDPRIIIKTDLDEIEDKVTQVTKKILK